jgi:hypothetical protein
MEMVFREFEQPVAAISEQLLWDDGQNGTFSDLEDFQFNKFGLALSCLFLADLNLRCSRRVRM